MAEARTPREAWIEAAAKALAAGGPEAVRVEPLAAGLGVTKGGFYWHFKNRAALLEEVRDEWERRAVEDVIAEVEGDPGDPRAKLRHLFALASKAGGALMPVELAMRDWARRDRQVAAQLRRIDDRRMDYMRSLFAPICADEDDVEVRSLLAFSLFIGTYFIVAEHRGRRRSEILELALERLLA